MHAEEVYRRVEARRETRSALARSITDIARRHAALPDY